MRSKRDAIARMRSEARIRLRLRLKRQRLIYRSLKSSRHLTEIKNNSNQIEPSDILAFSTLRNEIQRLPYFLEYYRNLGVRHFLMVDNASTDGSAAYLQNQPDVSLWSSEHSYRQSRFGVDWLTYLQFKYGHTHWCLTVDADELLVYPHHETRSLHALTAWMDAQNIPALAAMMLDLYPQSELNAQTYQSGQNPLDQLNWFDAGNYTIRVKEPMKNVWIQGGPRSRMFFADDPKRGPTLNKFPLIKWNRRFAYVNSTHSLLPRHLNQFDYPWSGETISGALLHTKFLDVIVQKSAEELERKQHFHNSAPFRNYHRALATAPNLWCEGSTKYKDWRQLEELGIISTGGWV